MFKKLGIIEVASEGLDLDEFMMAALEAGAEDVTDEGETFEVVTDYKRLQKI